MFKKLAVAAATCLIAIPALAIDNTGATAVIRLAAQVQTPSSVSESMPEMTGGQDHPTMGKKPATK